MLAVWCGAKGRPRLGPSVGLLSGNLPAAGSWVRIPGEFAFATLKELPEEPPMKARLLGMVLSLAVAPALIAADSPADLDAKDVFQFGFPQFLVFRGEMIRPAHTDYATWSGYFGSASGVIRKFVREELPGIHPESPQWADRFALEHPRKLVLLHLNGESRQVLDFPEVHARYFPGHWVHEPGSLLTASVGPDETVLEVDNAKPFTTKAYINREKDGGKSWFPKIGRAHV